MISTRWLEKRKPHWSKLESLLNQSAQGGLKSLSRSDLQELSLLYRQTAADLAAIREDREISPINREPDKNGHRRPHQLWKKVEHRESQRHEDQKYNSGYEIQSCLD